MWSDIENSTESTWTGKSTLGLQGSTGTTESELLATLVCLRYCHLFVDVVSSSRPPALPSLVSPHHVTLTKTPLIGSCLSASLHTLCTWFKCDLMTSPTRLLILLTGGLSSSALIGWAHHVIPLNFIQLAVVAPVWNRLHDVIGMSRVPDCHVTHSCSREILEQFQSNSRAIPEQIQSNSRAIPQQVQSRTLNAPHAISYPWNTTA